MVLGPNRAAKATKLAAALLRFSRPAGRDGCDGGNAHDRARETGRARVSDEPKQIVVEHLHSFPSVLELISLCVSMGRAKTAVMSGSPHDEDAILFILLIGEE